ncbi:unnamed protein product [Spodoptera littoralis]|uniref:Uncharacterized protein n=1 Tax=Spodoptera littoralis TaxID=7109 RepID=A0A9P0I547_SPOLI|nr:unnamed protein product [Spodoptera littoralis]CAH1641582.1 unnamed protein product [Spodoptera littoralis]
MCEIFPEVNNCCSFLSIRMGMLFIAILSISTGAITLGVVEQKTNIDYDQVLSIYNNATNSTKPEQALSDLNGIIITTITVMSVIFMLAGLCLLFATLADQEGYAQGFVWLIFLNILLGLLIILAITYECLMKSKCFLGHMDWLSGAIALIIVVFYLILWFYFISVANTYVLNGNT